MKFEGLGAFVQSYTLSLVPLICSQQKQLVTLDNDSLEDQQMQHNLYMNTKKSKISYRSDSSFC